MIRHLFKLMWNRKRSNFLMIVEIFFSFLVLFGVSCLLLNFYANSKLPLGYQYENVWMLTTYAHDTPDAEKRARMSQLMKRLDAFPQIEHAALASNNGPYSNSMSVTNLKLDNKKKDANIITVQDNAFYDAMSLTLVSGRWFNDQDEASHRNPVVITQDVADYFFGQEPAVGKTIQHGDTEKTVVGVVSAYKPSGEMGRFASSYFERTSLNDTTARVQDAVYLKIKPGTSPQFEEEILEAASSIGTGWTINLRQMKDMRSSYLKQILVPMVILAIVCAFLILNVALGLFGVLWHSINKRHSEIGLRRAIGATGGDVYRQFIGEILVVATFGLMLGSFFAVQFPLLDLIEDFRTEIYIQAIVVSVLLIYALVILCALYPSRQAATIHPAIALHED